MRKSCRVVKLIDLRPDQYVTVVAKVASIRVREVWDELGSKQIFSGSLEDETFRVPYVCHKTTLPLDRGSTSWIRGRPYFSSEIVRLS